MEKAFHFSVWILTALYSLYNVYKFTTDVTLKSHLAEDLSEGWSVLGRPKDSSDYEWSSWKQFALNLLPWVVANFVGAELFRSQKIIVKYWYCAVSFGFTAYTFGIFPLTLLVIQPLIYFITLKTFGKVKAIWFCSCSFLIITNMAENIYEYLALHNSASLFEMSTEDMFMTLITILWTQLRCISYCLDIIAAKKSSHFKFDKKKCKMPPKLIDLMSYAFYLPLFFLGPLILYGDFGQSLNSISYKSFFTRLKNFLINMSRYLWWLFFLELSLHFIYFNSLQYHVEVFHVMPDWCLYGGGLWMGLYFYIKYLIIYGIAGSFAALDTINPETPPRCIARVHRYSQMWKYFDVGLHKFLIKYIFKPTIDGASKKPLVKQIITRCLGSLLCFMFVFFWHGAHDFILVWTILNFFGIVVENIGKTISLSDSYKNFKSEYKISDIAMDRLNALLTTPVLIISALSNFYFFAGSEIGEVYVNRVRNQSFASFLVMIFILYSSCRASQYLNNMHARSIRF